MSTLTPENPAPEKSVIGAQQHEKPLEKVENALEEVLDEAVGGKPPEKGSREILPSERFFDKAVYGGISYAAQAGAGIILSRWLKFGGGNKYYTKMAEWAGTKLCSAKTAEEAIKVASRPVIVTTMIGVGTAFLLPVKWLENRKPQVVRWLHERDVAKEEARGHVFTPEEKAHDQKCLEQLENEPKQTWKSLLGGRAFGLAAVYAVLLATPKANERIENFAVKNILKGVDTVGLKTLAKSKKLDQYLHIGFLDVFYSAVSAGGLYVYSHYIRPPKKANAAVEAKVEEPVATPPTEQEPNTPQKSFAASVNPMKKPVIEPSSLHTEKLAQKSNNPEQPATALSI